MRLVEGMLPSNQKTLSGASATPALDWSARGEQAVRSREGARPSWSSGITSLLLAADVLPRPLLSAGLATAPRAGRAS